jgi:hypothetical protein
MGWKQPIDTSLEYEFGEDLQSYALFVMLLLKANNSKRTVGIGKKFIEVERGQVLFGRNYFSKYLDWNEHKVERILKRLEKTHKKVSNKVSNNGTVVSILDYDKLVSMNEQVNEQVSKQQASNKQASSEQVVSTNKSDNNEKSDQPPLSPPQGGPQKEWKDMNEEEREAARPKFLNEEPIEVTREKQRLAQIERKKEALEEATYEEAVAKLDKVWAEREKGRDEDGKWIKRPDKWHSHLDKLYA